MEFVDKHLEMRGMKRIELVNYFISIGGNTMSGENFIGQGWEAEITQEKIITLGSLKIPATIVILHCRKRSYRADDACLPFKIFISWGIEKYYMRDKGNQFNLTDSLIIVILFKFTGIIIFSKGSYGRMSTT